MKISWHPHPTLCPCGLRDWSRISWHQHLERTPQGVVFGDRTERDTAGLERQSERMMEFSEEAEGRPKDAVEAKEIGTDKLPGIDT